MLNPATLPAPAPPPRPAIAHWTHTLALLFILTLTALYGHTHTTAELLNASPRIPRYVSSIIAEWLLLGAVIGGIYLRRPFFTQALLQPVRGVAQSFGFGLAVYVGSAFVVGAVRALLYLTPIGHQVNTEVILAMAPHTSAEFLFWFALSLTAGICEELVFRGYLMQQFSAWLPGIYAPVLAILLTGLLFGGVHLYEGLGAVLPLAALGIVYGFVTRYFKGDLRPVILAHFLQDFLVALLVPSLRHASSPR